MIQLPALMVQDPNIFGRFAQGQELANRNRLLDLNVQNQEFQQHRATANDQFQREQFTTQQEQIMRQAEGMYFGRVGDMLAEYQGQPEIQRQIWKGARAKGEEIGIRDIHEMDDIDPTLPESIQMIRGQAAAYGYGKPQGSGAKAFAPVPMTDASGKFSGYGLPTFDPNTGQASMQPISAPGGQQFANPITMAGQKKAAEEAGKLGEQVKTKPLVEAGVTAAKSGIEQSNKAIESLSKIKANIANIDDAIVALDKGAETGAIASRFPSIKAASIELDNIAGRMGLDVINSATFGALSEDERRFAVDTALPRGLDGPELKAWLFRKKQAQQKLAKELEDAAIYLGKPGNTPAGWLEFRRNSGPQPGEEPSIDDLVNKYAPQ